MRHAVERAWDHYGLSLDARDLGRIEGAIFHHDPTALDLGPRPDGSRLVAVFYKHTWLAACTDGGSYVMTFLPRFTLDEHRAVLWERKQELRAHKHKGDRVPDTQRGG